MPLTIAPALYDVAALRIFMSIPEERVNELLASIEDRKDFYWEDRTEDSTAYWGTFARFPGYYLQFGYLEKGCGVEVEVWPHGEDLDRLDYTKAPSEMSLSQRLAVAAIIRAFL